MTDLTDIAETLVDTVRAAHTSRARAVVLVQAQLRLAHERGVVTGTEATGDMVIRLFEITSARRPEQRT